MTRREAYDSLKAVRGELDATKFSLTDTIRTIAVDVKKLQEAGRSGITASDLLRSRNNLELTYILRLFCEFEAAVRAYWISEVRNSKPRMEVLLSRVADRLGIAPNDLAEAQQIRNYRNNITHQNPHALTYTFEDCVKVLGIYLRWFPIQW